MNMIYQICDRGFLFWKKLETANSFIIQTLCQKHVFLSEDKNNSNMEEKFYMAEYFSFRGHEV